MTPPVLLIPECSRRLTLALLLLWLGVPPPTRAADPAPPDLFGAFTLEEFRALPAAQAEIDPADFREELLSAAVFHETNRRRAEFKLPALRSDARVRAAALGHSREMAEHRTLSHGTPWRLGNPTTPSDRLVQQGLQPRFAAENIAFNFLLRYESGRPFYKRQENGRTVYSYTPGGPPLPRHTYLSFAEAILTQWMSSPPHRENIVATEPEFLGVGCAPAIDPASGDIKTNIYATQNFFAPRPDTPPTEAPSPSSPAVVKEPSAAPAAFMGEPMSASSILALLLSLATLFSCVNHRFIRLPPTVGLTLLSLVLVSPPAASSQDGLSGISGKIRSSL